jgi:serine/threonine-protein kinase
MTTDVLHPDQLGPGSMVGTFRILAVLGAGSFGRVFKAERDGDLYALKMALRPASAELQPGEEDVDGRLAREASALTARLRHPNLPPVEAMDFWPHPRGYRFLARRYVEADTFTAWCQRERPSAARLVDVFGELVRAVGYLHQHGVHHRDLKGDNILITRKEARPLLIDFGAAHLPGASSLTVGLPPGAPHMLPPEAIAFWRSEVWKEGARFEDGAAMDLYALGHLLYEALTDHHPFDPRLPTAELLVAIETVVPRAPHYMNPKVPRALSDITMRLLAKQPEDRFESTEALGQALWEAAKAERKTRAWRMPLELPRGAPAPVTHQEAEERKARQKEVTRQVKEAGAAKALAAKELEALLGLVEQLRPTAAEPEAPAAPPRPKWPLALAALIVLAGGLALWATLAPSPTAEKGIAPVSTQPQQPRSSPTPEASHSGPPRLLAFLLCTTVSMGCPGAQVRLPVPGEHCSEEATRVMFQELDLQSGGLRAELDVHQPANPEDVGLLGTYVDGPIVGRVTKGPSGLPPGTLLYGRVWTGPGIIQDTIPPAEAAIVRYTEAVLANGRKVPVCIAIAGRGSWPVRPGSKPGTSVLIPRELPLLAVWRWP